MSCLNPIIVSNPGYRRDPLGSLVYPKTLPSRYYEDYYYAYVHHLYDSHISVPCGDCVECLRARAADIRSRLLIEYLKPTTKNAIFVTLTLSPDYYDIDNSSLYVRRFWDRWRKTSLPRPSAYFLIDELGEQTGRYHYHGIFYNYPYDHQNWRVIKSHAQHYIAKIWGYGHVFVGYANPRTFNYITKYITKPNENDPFFRPRTWSSLGLGYDPRYDILAKYVIDHENDPDPPAFSVAGKRAALPRTYRRRYLTPPKKNERWQRNYEKGGFVTYRFKGLTFASRDAYESYIAAIREQCAPFGRPRVRNKAVAGLTDNLAFDSTYFKLTEF